MQRPTDETLTGAVLAEICVRTGSTAFLEGSIAPLGSRFVVGLKTTSCQDDELIDQAQVEVERKEDVLRGIDDLAAGFRQRSGESAASRQKYATALPEATTPSLDALKAFTTARRVNNAKGVIAAIPFWVRTLEIDPQFASAWASLGLAYNIQGNTMLAVDAATKAYQLRDRTTEHERFMIDGLYQRQVTGNLERARQVFETWAATYPRDAEAHGLLAGFSTQGTGRYEQTIAEAEKARAVDPDQSFAYTNMISAQVYLDRLEDAERTIQLAVDRKIEISDLPLFQYQVAFLRNDHEGMARHAAAGRLIPTTDDRMAHLEALVAARAGRIDDARAAEQRAIALAERDGQKARAAIYYGTIAIFESFAGHEQQARLAATSALRLSNGRDSTYAAAFTLSRLGDRARAAELTAELQRRFPEDTSVQYNYLPTLRAIEALQSRDPERAIAILEDARTYELAVPALAFIDFLGAFYPPFIRGEAYLMMGKRDDAAGEFRRILEHRGLLLADPVGAVIERELAKLKESPARAVS